MITEYAIMGILVMLGILTLSFDRMDDEDK